MIVLYGIPSEPPLALVADALARTGIEFCVLNQRDLTRTRVDVEVTPAGILGYWQIGAEPALHLETIDAIYARPMDPRMLPEFESADDVGREHVLNLDAILRVILNDLPALVVNRPRYMHSNASKLFQALLIRQHGFHTPETLVTNDWGLVHEFKRSVGRVVFKSMSSVRSIVRELPDVPRDLPPMPIPVQFQEYVSGTDVRVHVIADEVHATSIYHDAVDYRDVARTRCALVTCTQEMPRALSRRCIDLARSLKLSFAGIDLRVRDDGVVYCFEVNPSPGYSYYQSGTGQPIAATVAAHLANRCAEKF